MLEKWGYVVVCTKHVFNVEYDQVCACMKYEPCLWLDQPYGLCCTLTNETQCTEMRFDSFLSGRFTTMAVINPTERKLAKRTSVQWVEIKYKGAVTF